MTQDALLHTGTLPASLATHKRLQKLVLRSNALSGPLPAAWVDGWPGVTNSSLTDLRMSLNNFSGAFPAGLARAPYLAILLIANNNLRCCWEAATLPS